MDQNQHSLATYVSDMLALERHVHHPFETQAKDEDFAKFGPAQALVTQLMHTSRSHIEGLEESLKVLGGHEASPVKSAVTNIEGFFAGAIDKIRKTKVSKSLRDDYTALSLCTAGYTMLTATANAMGDSGVATLAERHLRDYAQLVMDISQALPRVVVEELQQIGLDVQTSTIEQSRKIVTSMWRSGSDGQAESTATTTPAL